MSDDFMGGMFDFNSDGKTDAGEEYIAFQMFDKSITGTNTNKSNSSSNKTRTTGIKVWHIVLGVLLLIYWISTLTNPYNRASSYGYRNYKSSGYSSTPRSSYSSSKSCNTDTMALTKEEANALRGTGYHGTKPNSSAENMELAAAQVKCKKCGKHSTNGYNSMCNACRKKYGGY